MGIIKNQRNQDGKRHGFWEESDYVLYHDGKLWYKGYWKDDKPHGYWEEYWDFDEVMLYKKFHI